MTSADGAMGKKSLGAISLYQPTLAVALALVALVLIGAELLARTSLARQFLLTPSYGTTHLLFEVKLDMLEAFARQGPIDCILIGNSTVARGLNPEVLERSYRAHGGRKSLRCFNFGIDSATANTTLSLAKLLVERFHPRLLIEGTSPYDFEPGHRPKVITASRWMRWVVGDQFTLRGWFAENSAAYRYLLRHRSWSRPDYWRQMEAVERWRNRLAGDGFLPMNGTKKGGLRLRPCSKTADVRAFHGRVRNTFARLAEFRSRSVEVTAVEMPFMVNARICYRQNPKRYEQLSIAVGQHAEREGVPYVRTFPFDEIIRSGLWDTGHMNQVGAERLSLLMGEKLAQMERL